MVSSQLAFYNPQRQKKGPDLSRPWYRFTPFSPAVYTAMATNKASKDALFKCWHVLFPLISVCCRSKGSCQCVFNCCCCPCPGLSLGSQNIPFIHGRQMSMVYSH